MNARKSTGGLRPGDPDKVRCRHLRRVLQDPELSNATLQRLIDAAKDALDAEPSEKDIIERAVEIHFSAQRSGSGGSNAERKRPAEPSGSGGGGGGGHGGGGDHDGPAAQRQRVDAPRRREWVYILVHDVELSDSGSDYFRSDMHEATPSRDTAIVSVHSSYEGAARAAAEFVCDEWPKSASLFEDDETFDFDWIRKGFFVHEGDSHHDGCDERVWIQKHELQA